MTSQSWLIQLIWRDEYDPEVDNVSYRAYHRFYSIFGAGNNSMTLLLQISLRFIYVYQTLTWLDLILFVCLFVWLVVCLVGCLFLFLEKVCCGEYCVDGD